MFNKPCICILSSLLCAGVVIVEAQEKTVTEAPAPAQSKQQDFGKGFSMLFQMGLPRQEGAQPALINIYSGPASTHNYGINSIGSQITGWIKTADKNTEPATCLVGGVFECKLYDQSALMKMQSEKIKKNSTKKLSKRQMYSMIMPEQNCFSGRWKISTSAKITEDIKKLLQNKNNEYLFRSDKSKYGLLLLQAAQLYESGAKPEANEIAGMLFRAGGSKEVLQAAINVLAESKYLRAYCDFIESKDWGKFNADLEGIISKFKNNWGDVRYVKAVQAAVAARIRNSEPPELKTLNPLASEDRELVAGLSKMSQADFDSSSGLEHRYSGDFWLFPADKNNDKTDEEADNAPKTPNALDKIKAGGIKSVPLLIAMLDDQWLLSFKDRNGYSRQTFRVDSEDNDNEEKAEVKQDASLFEAAEHLEMPMTRGKLARKLLEPLLIPENQEQAYAISQKKDEEFKALCLAWYESIKILSGKDLQKKYLSDGSEFQKTLIIRSMIAGVDDTTAPLIEKALLESDSNMMNQDLLLSYCEARKDKAKPFIEKLRTKLYQQLDKQFNGQNQAVVEGMPSKEKAKADLDKFLEQLNQSKPKASLEDVVKEMLATTNEEEFMHIVQKFARAAKGRPTEKIYQICLDAATQAKDPKQKLFLLSMLQIPYEGKQKSKLDITKFKVQLEKLLDDQSELSEKFGGRQAIPLIAACMVESMAKKKLEGETDDMSNMLELADLYGRWDEKYTQYLIRRAKAILAGANVDKLPTLVKADELKDAQISEAKARIAGKSEGDIKELCRPAQLEELIPLSVAIQQDKLLNGKLLLLANQIVDADSDIPEIKDQIVKFKGKTLNEQVLQDIFKLVENCMQNGQKVEGALLRRPCLQGVVLKLNRPDVNARNRNMNAGMGGASNRQMLSAYLAFSGSQHEGMSRMIAVKNKPQEKNLDQALAENVNVDSEINESQKEQEKKFIEAFSSAFLKDGNALWAGKIIINGMSF